MKVKCPGCKRTLYETTKTYDPNRPATGDMLELLEPWKSRGWGKYESGYYGGKSVLASEMLCVECGAPLAPSGRVAVVEEKPEKPFICAVCGWAGKTEKALKTHTTMKHKEI